MQEFYTNTTTNPTREIRNPVHRKLKLSSTINHQQYYQSMATKLQQLGDGGQRPHLVIGDHSLPDMRYHQPVPGKGLRKKLRSHGFDISLINEYPTSQICPYCHNRDDRLQDFRLCHNPRRPSTGRLRYKPLSLRWGLLRCSNNVRAVNNTNRRIVNRDMAAVLNFRTITNSYAHGHDLPAAFQRRQQGQ
ncbi:hypothetical protein MBANPS3_012496 [Mucor bainieri]